jgi:hypothetical protein
MSRGSDRLTRLKISENGETGGGRSNVLESMTTHNRSERINLLVIEFEKLGKGVQPRCDEPVVRAGVFGRKQNKE